MKPEERKKLNEILDLYKNGVSLEVQVLQANFQEASRLLYNAVKENELCYGEFLYLLNKIKK